MRAHDRVARAVGRLKERAFSWGDSPWNLPADDLEVFVVDDLDAADLHTISERHRLVFSKSVLDGGDITFRFAGTWPEHAFWAEGLPAVAVRDASLVPWAEGTVSHSEGGFDWSEGYGCIDLAGTTDLGAVFACLEALRARGGRVVEELPEGGVDAPSVRWSAEWNMHVFDPSGALRSDPTVAFAGDADVIREAFASPRWTFQRTDVDDLFKLVRTAASGVSLPVPSVRTEPRQRSWELGEWRSEAVAAPAPCRIRHLVPNADATKVAVLWAGGKYRNAHPSNLTLHRLPDGVEERRLGADYVDCIGVDFLPDGRVLSAWARPEKQAGTVLRVFEPERNASFVIAETEGPIPNRDSTAGSSTDRAGHLVSLVDGAAVRVLSVGAPGERPVKAAASTGAVVRRGVVRRRAKSPASSAWNTVSRVWAIDRILPGRRSATCRGPRRRPRSPTGSLASSAFLPTALTSGFR